MSGGCDKDKKGFSGLADLVSEVGGVDEIVKPKPALEAKPSRVNKVSPSEMNTEIDIEPNRKVVTSPPMLGMIALPWKWILGIIAVAFIIALINNGMKNSKKQSFNTTSPTLKSYKNHNSRNTLARKIENGKKRAKQMEMQIKDMDDRLNDYERRMRSYRASGMKDEYNALVPSFNTLVSERNDLYEEYDRLVNDVNTKVKRYNLGYR